MRAYAPGSVTTVFAPPADGADRSRGASVAIADGVTVDVTDAPATSITVDGEPSSVEAVSLVLETLGVTAAVDIEPAVPLGCGFGASGAATLATALAADELFGLGRDRPALVGAAHEAELAARTGMGDVFVQDRGGIVVGTGDGIIRIASEAVLQYDSYGSIETGSVIDDETAMDGIRRAGEDVLAGLDGTITVETLIADSWAFARETGLVTDRVAAAVQAVQDAGGVATMAMLGETVVGVGARDTLAHSTRVAPDGAALC